MDPTPNEAEMREATEWCTKFVLNSGDHPYPINAYAAALAKCRVDREKYVGHCQHCKTTIQNKDGCVFDSRGMFHPICAATLAERERCAKVAESPTIWFREIDVVETNQRAVARMIAAAIRGGAE